MAEIKYRIRCLEKLSIYDVDHLYRELNEVGKMKVEINTWPDVTFTSRASFFDMEKLLNSKTDENKGPILSWNTIPPIKKRFRKTVSAIKKKVRSIIKG